MISTSNNNKYIESKNIRVFPCAYRGYYSKTITEGEEETLTTHVFDPEARATTEANFTNTFHKLSAAKDSYVVSWTPGASSDSGTVPGTLKCVIGGYYFEIYNQTLEDFFYTDKDNSIKPYTLCIQTEDISLGTSETDSNRTTEVLKSFAETSNYLDIYMQAANDYAFTGLILSKNETLGTANLVPFLVNYEFQEYGTVSEEDSCIGYYYLNSLTNQYELISSNSPTSIGDTAYARIVSYRVDPVRLPVTNLLDVGTGEFSVRMLEDINETDTNTTVASGDYSVALGKHTKAEGLASVAMGNNTVASGHGAISAGVKTIAEGDGATSLGTESKALGAGSLAIGNGTTALTTGSVALGNNTTAEGEGALTAGNATTTKAAGAVALGSNTIATTDNQVVIGKYNQVDSSKAFILANGDSDRTDSANTFTVSYTGDIKALGNLEVNGNQNINGQEKAAIMSTGPAANDLILGTPSTGSKGSIEVYGDGESLVFQVADTGNTTIAGETFIRSQRPSTTSSSGALRVAGGVGVGRDLNVGGNANVNGSLEVKGTLTSKNGLTVQGNGVDLATTILNTSLEVRDAVTLNQNLTVKQNVTLAASDEDLETPLDSPNTLTLGSSKLNISGALDIYGINTEKVFSVANTGATVINGDLTANTGTTKLSTTEISGVTTITNTADVLDNDAAFKVAGGVTIEKKLKVNGETNLGNTLTVDSLATLKGITTIAADTDYTKVNEAIVAALKVAGGTYIAKKLHVDGGAYIAKKLHVAGDTTFYDNLEITDSRVAIKKATASTAANNGAFVVAGGVGIGGNVHGAGSASFAQNVTIAGTGNTANLLKIGNESSSNKGGALQIYGPGTTPVFEVNPQGETTVAGNLTVGKNIKVDNDYNLSFGTGTTALTISKAGISNLASLDISGPVNAAYFNARGYTTSSDVRLKHNIEDYKFKNSILALPIKQFEYIQDDTHTKHIGCLAQDLQLICPELVLETPDGSLVIQESKLIYALLQEVKELKEKVTQLERK